MATHTARHSASSNPTGPAGPTGPTGPQGPSGPTPHTSSAGTTHRAKPLARVVFFEWVKSAIGSPYEWAGADTIQPGYKVPGFDCSGLASWAASKVGITIPHNTVAQFKSLPETNDPHAGDLVYFNNGNPGDAQPGHMGVCSNKGCTLMIAAQQTGTNVQELPTSFGGQVMGYRALGGPKTVGYNTAPGTPSPPGGPGPSGPAGSRGATSPGQKASETAYATQPHKAGQCNPNTGLNVNPVSHVSGLVSWIPFIGSSLSTPVRLFDQCQVKALLGGLCVVFGGNLMMVGGLLLGVVALQKVPGVKQVASMIPQGRIMGAAMGRGAARTGARGTGGGSRGRSSGARGGGPRAGGAGRRGRSFWEGDEDDKMYEEAERRAREAFNQRQSYEGPGRGFGGKG